MLDSLIEGQAAGAEIVPAVPAQAKQKIAGIAILGSNPATVGLAPFDKSDWAIYSCSPDNTPYGNGKNARALPRVDQTFEVHIPIADATRSYAYLQYVASLPFVWLRDVKALPHFKGGRLYPEKELRGTVTLQNVKFRDDKGNTAVDVAEVPNMDGLFNPYMFTSSIAYMLAKAIVDCEEQSIRRIGLWGIMQQAENEYCAAPQTRALTADLRWVPVGDLKVGDELIAFDENPGYTSTGWGGDTEEKKANGATSAFRKYRKAIVDATGEVRMPCFKFHMADGTTLVSSANHKWLNRESHWIESRHVRDSSQYPGATQIMKIMDTWTEELSWEAGYLAAAVDGEGCLTQVRHDGKDIVKLSFAQRPNAMRDEVLRAAQSYGFEFMCIAKDTDCSEYVLKGGKRAVMEFLGRFRPPRLLGKFDPERIGTMYRKEFVPVDKVEFVGEQTVIALSTTTGTFVAEGFASHNTYQRPGIQYFLHEAMRRGIKVIANRESCLFDMPKWKW